MVDIIQAIAKFSLKYYTFYYLLDDVSAMWTLHQTPHHIWSPHQHINGPVKENTCRIIFNAIIFHNLNFKDIYTIIIENLDFHFLDHIS